jgi:hypothetical protein
MWLIGPFPRIHTYFFKIHSNIGLRKGFSPIGIPVSTILATWPAHLNLLDVIALNKLGERYKLWSSSLWRLYYFSFASLLSPNIFLRILFWNTLSLHSFLNVRDHVSQPYSTTGNIIVLYILIFKFALNILHLTVY